MRLAKAVYTQLSKGIYGGCNPSECSYSGYFIKHRNKWNLIELISTHSPLYSLSTLVCLNPYM